MRITRNKAIKILMHLQVALCQEKWATQKMINALFNVQMLIKKTKES